MAKTYKLDIFEVLRNIDKGNVDYWEKLTEEQQKDFSPLVIAMWLYGTQNKTQNLFMSEFVTPFLFDLSDHKQLLFNLMVVASQKSDGKYKFVKGKPKGKSYLNVKKMISEYTGCSIRQVDIQFYSNEDLKQMSTELGYQKEELAKIRKEINSR